MFGGLRHAACCNAPGVDFLGPRITGITEISGISDHTLSVDFEVREVVEVTQLATAAALEAGICWICGELVVATLLRDLGQDSIKQCQVVIREKPEVREREKVVEAHPKWVVRVVRAVPATCCYSRCS